MRQPCGLEKIRSCHGLHLPRPSAMSSSTADPLPPAGPSAMKRISRKDIDKMSMPQILAASAAPYKKLFAYLRPYRFRFALAVLCGVIYAGVNMGLLRLIKHVSDQVFPDGQHALTLAERTHGGGAITAIMWTCLLIPAMMSVRALFGYLNSYLMSWVSLRMLDDIRGDLFRKILSQSMEFFNKQKSGDLMQLVFNQTRVAQQNLTQITADVIKEPLTIIGTVIYMFSIDPMFTFGALVLFPLCIIPVVLVSKKVRKAGQAEEQEAGNMNVIMQEAFLGIRLVKSNSRENYEVERFNESNQKMLRNMLKWQKALQAVQQLVEVVASFGVAAALAYVYWKSQVEGIGGAGLFITLNTAIIGLYPPAKSLSRIPILLQKCLAATTKIFEYMDRPVKVADAPDATVITQCSGRVEYTNASFFYEKGKPAVQDITLRIEPGERVALVGPSGAGKSTLFSLLLRLYDPEQGSVSLDGRDIRSISQASLREHIGVVSQDVFLFHDTIIENIRYGRLDATEEEIIEAAKRAHAHEFILAQSNGYHTVIGDKGCNLSGGQQQRLAIARAFLRNAPILMLDEATSALDGESERLIQGDLEELAKGRTVIAIAHRLSTIRNSDKIVVMKDGRIVDMGTHEQLLQTSELYQHLHNLQHAEAVEATFPLNLPSIRELSD